MWEIILSEEIELWFQELDDDSYDAILVKIAILREIGPNLGRPHVDTVEESKHKNMKELRIQHKKHVYRLFFAFDPKRQAILLIGCDKRGNKGFYKRMIPVADKIFSRYLGGL
jgi:hypothetical protein